MGQTVKTFKVKTKQERLKDRKKMGPLSSIRITPTVYARYRKSLLTLFTFWQIHSLGPKSGDDIDRATSQFVEYQWAEGEPSYICNNALAALQFFLPLRGKLSYSWELLKTWHRKEPPVRVMPMHPLLLLGMAAVIYDQDFLSVAAMMLVGFDCMLRSGEIYRLQVKDIIFSSDRAVLNLRDTKTSQLTGYKDMVVCESSLAVTLLKSACKHRHPDDTVLAVSPSKFRKLFLGAANHFKLSERLTPYSLRRGGATWAFLQHGSMELVLLRGRWQSTKTARIYLQDAVAGLSDMRLSDSDKNTLRRAAMSLVSP